MKIIHSTIASSLLQKASLIILVSLIVSQTKAALDYEEKKQEELPFKVEPSHYLDHPITKKDFQEWDTVGASVILKNRTIITPETRDRKGMLYSKKPNPLTKDWLLEISLELGNDKNSVRGGTGVGIHYLKSVNIDGYKDGIFGYASRFEGLAIYLNSVLKSEGTQGEVFNAVQGFYNDGMRSINAFTEKKNICYKKLRNLPPNQQTRIRIQYDSPLITVQVFDIFSQTFEFCFSFEAPLDYNGFFVISGASGIHNPDHVFLHSIKLFNPKVVANNEHFQSARHQKAAHEEDISNAVRKGIKDLFEHHAQQDAHLKQGKNNSRDFSELIKLIPEQHNHLQHKLRQIVADDDSASTLYFETLGGLSEYQTYNQLNEKLFNFRIAVDSLSSALETEQSKFRTYEKKLKQVRYTANIQKGLEQYTVNNRHTKQLYADIQEIDTKMQQIAIALKDYHQAVKALDQKIQREAGFTARLEEDRRKFAEEMSKDLQYEISDLEDVFNEMELSVSGFGTGWSAIIVNFGMIAVILVSLMLYGKMRGYEQKNA